MLLPGLSLYRHRRQTTGFIFLLLQPTIIGWLIGAIVARRNLKRQRRRHRRDWIDDLWSDGIPSSATN